MSAEFKPSNRRGNRMRKATLPARPYVSHWRVSSIEKLLLAASIGLIVYDAYVSYIGFDKIMTDEYAPLVFSTLVFVSQLAIGILNALGVDFSSISGGSDNSLIDWFWTKFIFGLYAIDIFSNVISFGILEDSHMFILNPVEKIGESLMLVFLAAVLSFGDEILMRLYDLVHIAAQKSEVISGRYSASVKAHRAYNREFASLQKQRAVERAQLEARNWDYGDDL